MLLALLLQAASPGQSPLVPGLQPPAGPGQPPATMVVEPVAMAIAAFDADGDARTSRAELEAGVARSFAQADSGHTGAIGYIAFADWAERWLGDRNALPSPFEVDADGDNRITLAELQANLRHTFDRLDRNHDGYVTRQEVLTIRAMTNAADRPGRKRR